ncbi:hypothetical protein LZZ85_26365 [Terrimonas sp. NA20]|uniref:Uncharacterized protein n=1 Tax=Terrimonas ginsenosidimutans TaxID=2908004 RepID=A0ABS9KZU9_9BACT|nr:hypothetical protein [Terrimonas ginsenosidimutans]MCG2617853.1 hypothetical protein [Terrimonas ginsenosidimutans]
MNNNQNERQQNICIYGGVFGILISATCLIQLMTYTYYHWIAYMLPTIYVITLFVFLFLALQKLFAPVLMIISTVLSLIALAFVMIGRVYSLILIVHFLYCLTMTIVIYMENIPGLLKYRATLKKQEELAWKDKI